MRRSTICLALVLALSTGACTEEPATETAPAGSTDTGAPPVEAETTTTAVAPTSTTVAPTPSTVAPTSTTVAPTSTTVAEAGGMCGELIPVVTEDGTLCLTPEQAEWGVDVDPFWEGELPPLVVVGREGNVHSLEPNDEGRLDVAGERDMVGGWVVAVHAATDGSLVVERYVDDTFWPEVAIVAPDGTETVVPGAVRLYDVAVVDGDEVVLVSDVPWTHDGSAEPVEARRLSDPATVVFDLGPASGDFFEVEHAAVRGGLGVVGGYVDTTEFIELTPVIGDPASLADPLADLPDDMAPYATAATLSPDGTSVTWAEGPDTDGELGEVVGQAWVVRSVDTTSGEEQLWWPISEPVADTAELWVHSIHDLGDFILVNRTGWQGEDWVSFPALVIDFTVEEPDMWELPVAGLVAPVPVVG